MQSFQPQPCLCALVTGSCSHVQPLWGAPKPLRALVVKKSSAKAGDLRHSGSIPESGRSSEGGYGNPLQYSCLENPQGQRHLGSTVLQSWTELKQLSMHARFSCPSLSPGTCLNSCPLSQRCHPAISSSVNPFSCLQSFPASGSFPVSPELPRD